MSQTAQTMSQTPTSPRAILQKLQSDKIAADRLGKKPRQILVEYLLLQGWLVTEIADLTQKTNRTIQRDKLDIENKWKASFKRMDFDRVVSRFVARTEHLYRGAAMKGDLRLAHQISTEMIEKLQSLGIIYRASDKVELSIANLKQLGEDLASIVSREVPKERRQMVADQIMRLLLDGSDIPLEKEAVLLHPENVGRGVGVIR